MKNLNDRGFHQKVLNLVTQVAVGSDMVHEGLIFLTKNGKYYCCQTYPIQFKKVYSLEDGIKKIKDNWTLKNTYNNIDAIRCEDHKKYFTVKNVVDIVEKLPNEYDLYMYNCQDFCFRIKSELGFCLEGTNVLKFLNQGLKKSFNPK